VARRIRDFVEPEPVGIDLAAITEADVAIHFADGPHKFYQLMPWLAVLRQRPELRVIIVARQPESYEPLQALTDVPIALVPKFDALMALYDRANFRAVLYVNNSYTNFQSLAFQQAVHIHVNHGESDKICMVSNQAKAYDRVFVAGQAAVDRHAAALAWFNLDHLTRVGRPQLDLAVADPLSSHDGPTITYAPTWEGEDEANNYTSLDRYGVAIIEAALAQPQARVIYKPHPRIPDSDTPAVRAAHQAIVARINSAPSELGHQVCLNEDILGVIRGTDLFIGDVSSVTLDHLYLRPKAPIVLTDRRNDRERLQADTPVASAAHIVDSSSIATLATDLGRLLNQDPMAAARHQVRDYYFDGLGPGESTQRFWVALDAAINDHDRAVANLKRVRNTAAEVA
jgi:hypothetical protein